MSQKRLAHTYTDAVAATDVVGKRDRLQQWLATWLVYTGLPAAKLKIHALYADHWQYDSQSQWGTCIA
jgi:hypothetical protein